MDITYMNNNKTAGKDIRHIIPGHFSFATFYTLYIYDFNIYHCFHVIIISGIPIGVFQSMFSVVAMETFKLDPSENGYILSYVGAISMVSNCEIF